MSQTKTENFVSTATIYKSGAGEPFAPGAVVPLHEDHAAELRAGGLEQKTEKQEEGSKGSRK